MGHDGVIKCLLERDGDEELPEGTSIVEEDSEDAQPEPEQPQAVDVQIQGAFD